MKNAAIATLLLAVAVLMGAKHQEPVTSISFDGGKTQLHGDIKIEIQPSNGGWVAPPYVDEKSGKVTIYIPAPGGAR